MMKNTTVKATINVNSTCNPRRRYEINRSISKNGIDERDKRLFFNDDGSFKEKPIMGDVEKANILALKAMGYTDLKIAQEMCISTCSVYKVKKEAGLVKPRAKRKEEGFVKPKAKRDPDNQLETAIVVMRNRGVKPKQIADLLDLDVFYVYRVVKKGKKKALISSNK